VQVVPQPAVAAVAPRPAPAAALPRPAPVVAGPAVQAAQMPAAAPRPNAVEMTDVSKAFGRRMAVNHLTLNVQPGEIFGLLGPNGAGKTTVMNMISGLNLQTSGSIRVLGYDVTRQARNVRAQLGYVSQETALYEELSAWRNMDFHAELFGIPRCDKNKRITQLLTMVHLIDRKDSLVKTFSGGMKRRLAIARALLHNPRLVYLDEPTLGVDVQARRAIWDYLIKLRQQGKTVIITTNYLEEAQALCDHLAIIDHGKLMVNDSMQHVQDTYGGGVMEVDTVYVTADLARLQALPHVVSATQEQRHIKVITRGADNLIMPVVNILSQKAGIAKISFRPLNLDEIFLNLTGTALRD
jgi:ABC-type multidrug transport system ATPase subunit